MGAHLLTTRGRGLRVVDTETSLGETAARQQGTGMRKSHDGDRVQFDALDLTLEKSMKMAVVGAAGQ